MACFAGLTKAQYIPAFRTDSAIWKDPGTDYWKKASGDVTDARNIGRRP